MVRRCRKKFRIPCSSGFSTKGPGRGMGLSIVQEILEQYGGQIDLDSTPRRTRFHGLIPYHRV